MIEVLDQQENYLLLTDGAKHFTVVEHRDGKFYSLRNSGRHGVKPDDAGFVELIQEAGSFTEPEARHILADVASQWRDLFEHIRRLDRLLAATGHSHVRSDSQRSRPTFDAVDRGLML